MKERKTVFASYLTTAITFIISIGLFTAIPYALGIKEVWDTGLWKGLILMYAVLVIFSASFIATIVGLITYFSNEL